VQAKHAHPTCSITLLNISSRRQRCAAVKDTNIIKAEKASLKDIFTLGVLTVDPPGKVKQQFMKDTFQEPAISTAGFLLVNFVNTPGCPGKHGRVDVSKGPLIGRQLTIWMHIPFSHQKIQLAFRKVAIDESERDTVECQIP